MSRKLRAPVGTDEANYGQTRYRVNNDGVVDVPDDAASALMDVGGFVAIDAPVSVDADVFADPVAKLKAPEGATCCTWDAVVFDVDREGFVYVPPSAVGALAAHGYVLIED